MIAGATATGKTALSLSLARVLGAEIVSADSRQVYTGMDIGTAKVPAATRRAIPHHGLDLVAPDEAFSVADYARSARAALELIARRGRVALLVGGTGLYLRSVARAVAFEPASSDPAVRGELERRLREGGLASLRAELQLRAPRLARATDLANPRRVVRALERAVLLGDRPVPRPAGYAGQLTWLGLRAEPDEHRAAIARRAAEQFAGGLLDEARRLLESHPPELPAFSAFGYREAFAVVQGEADVETAVARTAERTRAYARRQATWFRSEPGIHWLDAADPDLDKRALEQIYRVLGPLPG